MRGNLLRARGASDAKLRKPRPIKCVTTEFLE
jgi:hypothetical protein